MKPINKIYCIIISLVVPFLFSCSEEYSVDLDLPVQQGELTSVVMKLNTPEGFIPRTKSLGESQENEVKELFIFAFKSGVLSYVKAIDNINSNGQLNVQLKASGTSADTYKLMVLANSKELLSSLLGPELNGLNGETYDQIQQILNKTNINQPLYNTPGESIVMWGELPYLEINNSNNDLTVSLLRSISRIDVGVGAVSYDPATKLASWGGVSNFVLEGVYVYKPNNAFSFIPLSGNYDEDAKKVKNPSSLGVKLPSPFIYPVAGGISLVRSIYMPESEIRMSANGSSGDGNHTNRMALVVKGSYNGNSSSYYRLDFINNEKKLINVLRNHLYQFNIKSVSGNGFSTPDEAYEALSENMNIEVLEWNDGAIEDVIFNGQYHFGVSQSKFLLPGDQQTTIDSKNKLTATTDYPLGWSVEKIEDEFGNLANASWLTVDKSMGPAHTNTTLNLLADENMSGSERKAYVYFKAGRLAYKVEVIQKKQAEFIARKRFLTIGSSPNQYGYNFSGTAASNKLITTPSNFGTLPGSILKAEGFTIIDGGENPTEAQLVEWLIINPVDIVIIGYDNQNMNATIAGYYARYLSKGGVVLAFHDRVDNTVSGNFLKAVFNNSITLSYGGGAGSVYQLSAFDNEVLNGPFGDIRGKQWGEDASTTVRVAGIDPRLIDVLSDDSEISTNTAGIGAVTAFKHKTLNLVWVGDGGFNSNISGSDATICPFKLDGNNFPVAKSGYGKGPMKYAVYNSTFTANAIAWAMRQAELNGY